MDYETFGAPRPIKESEIRNCHFIGTGGPHFSGNDEPAMFSQGGNICVQMDGMLVAPLHLFSKRQLSALSRKARQQATD